MVRIPSQYENFIEEPSTSRAGSWSILFWHVCWYVILLSQPKNHSQSARYGAFGIIPSSLCYWKLRVYTPDPCKRDETHQILANAMRLTTRKHGLSIWIDIPRLHSLSTQSFMSRSLYPTDTEDQKEEFPFCNYHWFRTWIEQASPWGSGICLGRPGHYCNVFSCLKIMLRILFTQAYYSQGTEDHVANFDYKGILYTRKSTAIITLHCMWWNIYTDISNLQRMNSASS